MLPPHLFWRRVFLHTCVATAFMLASLMAGVVGYHLLGGLPWTDSLLNASMILGGMGPVDVLASKSAKVFASLYALYSGVAFLAVSAVLVAPFAHRLLHSLHLEEPSDGT